VLYELEISMKMRLFLIAIAIVGALGIAAVIGPVALTTPAFAPNFVNAPTPIFDPNKGSLVSTGEPVVVGDNATMMSGNMTSGIATGGNWTN